MSLCPNTNGGQCRCQPQDGVMCPYGPTPNDWKPWKEAAASARPLPPLPEPAGTVFDDGYWLQNKDGPLAKLARHASRRSDFYTVEQVNALILADRAASAPQAVRRPLTEEQIRTMRAEAKADPRCAEEHWFVLLVRAAEKYHGIVPLAPQDTGEK